MSTNVLAARDLGQHLAEVLRRVKAGEQFQINDEDEPMALLTPVPTDSMSLFKRLIAAGRITLPKADLCDLGPPSKQPTEISISEALQELREERLGG